MVNKVSPVAKCIAKLMVEIKQLHEMITAQAFTSHAKDKIFEELTDHIATLEAEVEQHVEQSAELTAKADRLMRHLESLTPSGSEFYNDPKRCVEWVRNQRGTIVAQVLKRKKAEAEVERLRGLLKFAHYALDDLGYASRGGSESAAMAIISAALEKGDRENGEH